MSENNFGDVVGGLAIVDLSSSQYHFVRVQSGGSALDLQIMTCSQAAERMMGVLLNDPTSGNHASVLVRPSIVKIKTAGALIAGDPVTTNAVGRAVAATSGQNVAGYAIVNVNSDAIGKIQFNPSVFIVA